jgi:hypothetical protein
MIQEWDIKPLAKACTGCGKPFVDRQEYSTRLADKEGNYLRADFCSDCWSREEPGYSNWSGVFRVPPAEPDRKVRKETTESILRELMDQGDPARAEIIYILAVMLERQRVLVEQKLEDAADGARRVIYVHRKTGEMFIIPDPGIAAERLETVQLAVMRLLAPDAAPRPGSVPETDTQPASPVSEPPVPESPAHGTGS